MQQFHDTYGVLILVSGRSLEQGKQLANEPEESFRAVTWFMRIKAWCLLQIQTLKVYRRID